MVDISKITTEKRNINTREIDAQDTYNLVKMLNNEDKTVPHSVEKALPQITSVVDIISEKFINSGRLIYMGAGTSGRIGILDASECPPTYGTDPEMVIALIAGGKEAMTVAVEGAEDNEELAAEDLQEIELNENDILIGISASGRTPYVMGGIRYAKSLGVTTSCITTSQGSPLGALVDNPIEVITGAEPVTGSTRMKSGTAQKLVCNMLTTASMIKMGKVYENLMIDVQPTNNKLISRAKMIVSEVTGISQEEAAVYIEHYQTVKKAIFSILTGVIKEERINYYLTTQHGHLRNAISYFKQHNI